MKLEERLNQVLAKHNLCVLTPTIEETPQPLPPEPKATIIINHGANYQTVKEGLKHLHEHEIDEDGIGCFTAKQIGFDKIQLPMAIDDYIVEDIQRAKTGNYQVHFRKSGID